MYKYIANHQNCHHSKLRGVRSSELYLKIYFYSLDAIQYIKYNFNNKEIKILPMELQGHQNQIIEKLQVKLPHYL